MFAGTICSKASVVQRSWDDVEEDDDDDDGVVTRRKSPTRFQGMKRL
jgi:hypothetical protein